MPFIFFLTRTLTSPQGILVYDWNSCKQYHPTGMKTKYWLIETFKCKKISDLDIPVIHWNPSFLNT